MKEVFDVIVSYFEAGRDQNTTKLKDIQLDDESFGTFSDVPPFELQNFENNIIYQELRFASLSDYNYKISNEKISIWGNVALVTFNLKQTGMLVDNKTFSGTFVDINGRATFVLVKKESWKILHIHISNSV
ncbi:MAG: nuclear transport factor 2 family protein [Candidatus Nitrosoabyssus spongiisocia]|nr:MAG: nuclear transport factor 2 family protein [Nitrosopumilaceae archaeon AB1(1)]